MSNICSTQPDFKSSHLAIGFSSTSPAFDYLSVDSLGGGKVDFNPLLVMPEDPVRVRLEKADGIYRYYPLFETNSSSPLWTVEFTEKKIVLRSEYHQLPPAPHGLENVIDFSLLFRQKACPATLLGRMVPDEQKMCLPCVLHMPDRGSMRITGTGADPEMNLNYEASRSLPKPMVPYVHIKFPAATVDYPVVEYQLEVAAIYPALPGLENDERFDGFRRNFLNMFQVLPRRQMLGTHASSDICPFTLFMFAEAATPRVKLAEGLYTSDLVRMTADRYLSGVKGYGQIGYEGFDIGKLQFLDVDPSLVLGSGIYIQSTDDWDWAREKQGAIMGLCRQMMSTDHNNNGLIKYGQSGNLNDRPTETRRPANWWDGINFGYEDAYSNALAYRALVVWAEVSERLGLSEDVSWLREKAAKLKAAYKETFLNPATGIFAGWKSLDGQLHDYWFLFLNSVAIAYGLADDALANEIMDRCLKKMSEVGFHNFRLGLPGNLIPILRGDYVYSIYDPQQHPHIYGIPKLEDGSDSFQYYQNGGAMMRYALFTLRALYRLGRIDEARQIFYPMLEGYKAGEYQGFHPNGNSNDMRTWQGKGCGYEGFAVGNYLPLLAVIDEWKSR